MNKIRIIEAGNELGMGGTEYAIQLYSKFLNKDYFELLVIGLHKGGERVKLIQDLGIKLIILNGDLLELARLLQSTDVFHWHGDGTLNDELFNIIKINRPKLVIQTNVFGEYDHSPLYEIIDYDLYISKMILIRRLYNDRNLDNDFAAKRKVLPYPVDVDNIDSLIPTSDKLQKFKQENGLQNCFIVGRIGRADDAKFDLITLDGYAEFASKVSNSRFLLVGATKKILAHARTLDITDKLIIFENTSDMEQLLVYYKAIDVFLAASNFGESFGMVIAEAMTAGVPVVTISTPDRDNAQIELIDNEQTGIVVARNSKKIADALFLLYNNEEVRKKLSSSSKPKILKEYHAVNIVKSFENLIYNHLQIPVINNEKSLIVDFSEELINEYVLRCTDLWEPGNKSKNHQV